MTINVGDGGGSRSITSIFYQDGIAKRTIVEVWIGDGGTKRLVWSAVVWTVTPSPTAVTLVGNRGDTLSSGVTAGSANHVGPLTFAWSWYIGGGAISITNGTTATCTVSSSTTAGPGAVSRTGTLQCVVTDTGNGGATKTIYVDVSMDWAGSG